MGKGRKSSASRTRVFIRTAVLVAALSVLPAASANAACNMITVRAQDSHYASFEKISLKTYACATGSTVTSAQKVDGGVQYTVLAGNAQGQTWYTPLKLADGGMRISGSAKNGGCLWKACGAYEVSSNATLRARSGVPYVANIGYSIPFTWSTWFYG